MYRGIKRVMLGAPSLLLVHPAFCSNFIIILASSSSFFKLFLLVCGICVSLSTLLVFFVEWGVAWVEVKVLLVVSLSELIHMFNFNIQIKLIRKVYMDQLDTYGLYGSTWSVWYQILKFVKIIFCFKYFYHQLL